MATTVFFEETIKDAAEGNDTLTFEVGRTSFLNGENLVYLNVDGKNLILNEKVGRDLLDAFSKLATYLNY